MRKKILAIVTSIMLSLSLLITPFASFAAGLTQATNAEKIEYGTLTQADKDFLNQFFDADYYAAKNPDVVGAVGNSREALFKHFCEKGIFEGRTCTTEFDPAAYASAYPELFALYGKNIMAYFRDFYSKTAAERATLIATLEACAKANITVKGLADDSIVITPELYYIAKQYNIDSLASAKAIQQALKTGQPTEVQGNGDGTVDEEDDIIIVPAGGNEDALLRAKGLTALPIQIVGEGGVTLKIYVSYDYVGDDDITVGAAIKDQDDNIIMTCQDYTDTPEYGESRQVGVIVIDKLTDTVDQEPAGPKFYTACLSYEFGEVAGNIECTSDTVYEINTDSYYADTNGEEDTEYSYTGNVALVEDDEFGYLITGSVGIYNEETGFGYVADYSTPLWAD
ncbi:MAG: hypothetical protein IKQ44_08335 [Lachnospiraceae bacterium]|nr:hypothetical protein [Lachnospiraceae bacterium]